MAGPVFFDTLASGYRRSAAAGTECGISSREETPTIRVSSQFVLLDALVADRKTRSTVGSLEAKDFLLRKREFRKIFPTSAMTRCRVCGFSVRPHGDGGTRSAISLAKGG